jgi:hypothetical protein
MEASTELAPALGTLDRLEMLESDHKAKAAAEMGINPHTELAIAF